AQALLGDPQLLVVDEPTAGLDPEERIRFRNLLARFSGQRTILLSTHIVADIEATCNALAVMDKGRVIFTGTPDLLIAQARGLVWQVEISPEHYDDLEHRHKVISSRVVAGGHLQARVIAQTPPDGAVAVEPGLEDGYVAVMGRLTAAGVSYA